MTTPDRRTLLMAGASTAAASLLQPELLAARPRLSAPVRVGLVGVGRQGRALLAELGKFETVTVAAYCDTDERRLSSAARRARDAQGHPDVASMLAAHPDLDAVIVATPTHKHRQPCEEALAAGKHVYCEAPLAHTVSDARAIAAAAASSGKVFQTGFQGRANPVYGLARSFVRSGAIRDMVTMRAQTNEKNSWQTPASDPARSKELNWRLDSEVTLGLPGEVGAQQFDVFHWFRGDYPVKVEAEGGVLAWRDGRTVADTVHARLTFKDGAALDWSATLGNSYEGTHEVMMGTMGAVKLAWSHGWLFKEADAPTQGWEVYANRQQFHNDEGITLIAEATKLASQGKLKEGVGLPNRPLWYALDDFLKAVTEGAEVSCSAEEGLRATAVAIKVQEALLAGEALAITDADLSSK